MQLTREDLQRIIKEELEAVLNEEKNPRIPRKKGQPAKSKKHSDLYTDEDPKGTIHGLKFATEADAKKSVAKIKKSGRSHAHKIQAAVAMEQRAKAAGKKSAAAVYRKYINSVKKDEELNERCQKGYKTHEKRKTKKMFGKTYRNCVKAEEGLEIEEVYSEKQRRYMCAMAEPDADRPEGLSQAEAEEMCSGPMKKEAKSYHWDEPDWFYGGGYGDGTLEEKKKKRKKAGTESGKESSLRDWFGRKGAKGKKKGWVDCNAPDGKGGYKSCGRGSGEKRKKYPACRPTPGACKERGKGKSWGKKAKKRGKKK